MTHWLGAAFLGLLQGLTEFLPVSSSGHLVLFQQFVEIGSDEVLFDLVLHVGTLLPVVWFYREPIVGYLRDLVRGDAPWLEREGVRMAGLVLLATLPTGLIGVLFQDVFEAWFATPAVLTLTFALTGGLMWWSRSLGGGTLDVHSMAWWHALLLGVAQGLAITPGISRSGTTIVVAMLIGLSPAFAARFSFLMSIPAIVGALLLKSRDVELASLDLGQLAVGGGVAMISGYAALVLLVRLVVKGRLSGFAWYCWAAALAAGAIALLRA